MITDIAQLDEAFMQKLLGMKVRDENDTLIDVPVLYINPEEEFKPESYPSIVFYRAGIYPDTSRWTNERYFDNAQYDSEGNLLSVDSREAPSPFYVFYGVRLYYTYQIDGVALTNGILARFKRGSYVSLANEKYDVELVSYKNPNSSYREFGVIKQNESREFIDQYFYKVEIEMDDGARKTIPVNRYGVEPRISIKD